MNQSQYLEFLRFYLNPQADIPECVKTIRWHELLQFAKKQSVVGTFYIGIKRLSDLLSDNSTNTSSIFVNNKPSDEDIMEWMGTYMAIVRQNQKINRALLPKLVVRSWRKNMGTI